VVSDPAAERTVLACGGYRFFCRNREEFERICHDVFDGHEYVFDTRRREPLIVDAGAHVGVATHYFKHRFPHARVLALEANPVTFALLRKNISHNGLDDVRAIHAALAPEAGTIPFFASASDEEPGAWGDSAIQQPWHEGEATAVVQVPAVTLSSLLTEPVDLLKLDIEGLETAVLEEAAPHLSLVRRVILEFHGTRCNPGNSISRLTEILRAAGFTPEVRQFGEEVALSAIQKDEPYWLMVRAERLNPWQRLRRRGRRFA
jgi:FkbM family methyltransferase